MAVTGTFGGFYFDPDVFTDYIQEADPVHTSIINSGVLRVAPEISAVLTDKNNVFTVPNYTPLTGDAKNYDGETDNTPVKSLPPSRPAWLSVVCPLGKTKTSLVS